MLSLELTKDDHLAVISVMPSFSKFSKTDVLEVRAELEPPCTATIAVLGRGVALSTVCRQGGLAAFVTCPIDVVKTLRQKHPTEGISQFLWPEKSPHCQGQVGSSAMVLL